MTLLDRPGNPGSSDDGRPSGKRAARPSGAVGGHRIRKDVEGLRAIAVLLVLPYHAGLKLLHGGFVGVDVFFVISGFVITAQLLREADRDGHVSLGRFYARRAKRLLPAAGLVLVATAAMVYFLVPKIRWANTGGDIVASALYFINYHLTGRAVDYLNEDIAKSPVQHYWSLSVEEQFYFVWPLLVLLAIWITNRMHRKATAAAGAVDSGESPSGPPLFRPVLLAVIGSLALVSLIWSTYSAHHSPDSAYFDTTGRMWEFAAGTIVAILITRFDRFPQWFGAALAWTGLLMILAAGFFYTDATTWPGAAALLPILGASFFIAGGAAAGSKGPVLILGNRPIQFIGALTYSLYLWHWPLLTVARDRYDGISVPVGMLIVILCVIPAWLSYKFVENPIRHSKFVSDHVRVALGVGVVSTLIAVVAGLMLALGFANASSTSSGPAPTSPFATDLPSAVAPDEPWDYDALPAPPLPTPPKTYGSLGDITPNPLAAVEDVPDLYDQGCQTAQDSAEVNVCTYGPDDADLTIAVVGDSKAAQWVPALQALTEKNNWKVTTYTKSACPFVDASVTLNGEAYSTCRDWGKDVLSRLTGDEKPDVVLTAQARRTAIVDENGDPKDTSEDAMRAGMESYWKKLQDAGVKVVGLADTPQTFKEVYTCVSEEFDKDVTPCGYDRQKGVDASGLSVQREAAEKAKIPFLDMTDYICPEGKTCPPIVGNILVYRQGSHITKTYVESLAPVLGRALENAVTWSEKQGDN
ncbi:acyltransferase family protein [Nocardioides plantarum]|uniref:Acyltransferase family protein n=1 Tax=Nocardioides plantarum TaxID=29299 RepID=A0ABV5K772_9ACTN|nr:acyltransferase family protein [Nocardioides plantarum]